MSIRFVIPALALAACSAPPPPPPIPPVVAPQTPVMPTAAPVKAASPSVAPPAEPAPITARFEREIEVPVSMIALEKPPHAAALGRDAVWVHDARGWRAEKLPPSARPSAGASVALFYGRDDRVRITGGHPDGAGARGVYLRWLPSGFRLDRSEIGKLGALTAPLVAVLGTEDPEIVCQPGDVCLVKRRSGWTTIDAPRDIARVVLGEGAGWAVAGRQLLKLGTRWENAGPPGEWQSADALFALRDRAWVVETAAARIHAFDGTRWSVLPSPITRPRALWGARGDALWLAGEDGLAFWDGTSFHRVKDAPAPLSAVLGRNADEVWIGGERGLYRVVRER